jgi:hypothetical protein
MQIIHAGNCQATAILTLLNHHSPLTEDEIQEYKGWFGYKDEPWPELEYPHNLRPASITECQDSLLWIGYGLILRDRVTEMQSLQNRSVVKEAKLLRLPSVIWVPGHCFVYDGFILHNKTADFTTAKDWIVQGILAKVR